MMSVIDCANSKSSGRAVISDLSIWRRSAGPSINESASGLATSVLLPAGQDPGGLPETMSFFAI